MTGIVTLTPSAAIDQTYLIDDLELGQVNRAHTAHSELSGKGVNVAHAVALVGHPVRAVLALGELDERAAAESASASILRPVIVPGSTRVNTTIIDGHGVTTKVNQASVPLSPKSWKQLVDATLAQLAEIDADWLVVCGSIPSLDDGTLVPFVDLLAEAASRGVRVALDTSGAALATAAQNFETLDLVKPNTLELSELVGRSLRTVGEVAEAARELIGRGVGTVYVSMGEDGALAVSGEDTWWARSRAAAVVNTAGAGDASLAGFLVGLSTADSAAAADSATGPLPVALSTAASWGALSVSQNTTLLSDVGDAVPAQLRRNPDPNTPLADPAIARAEEAAE